MKIKKMYQGTAPENKILNTQSDSQTDVYSCNYINKLNTYSTEEQVIGTWIDGKPLYRKVITFNSTIQSNTEFSLAHNITNYERVWIDISNTFIYSDLYTSPMPAIGYYQSLTDKLNVYIYGDYVLFYSNGGWGEAWTKVVTLNYTKTTD